MAFPENMPIDNVVLYDDSGNPVGVKFDPIDGVYRAQIEGKVAVAPPTAPPATTPVVFAAATPLIVSNEHDTFRVVAAGKTFTIQQIVAGAAGDPNEKGSAVEVYWAPNGDATGIEIISRIYLIGFSTFVTPNTSVTRAGTPLLGDGTAAILIRRRRIGGASQEIDAVIRGFEQ